jgi:hypothetical protein
VAEWLKAAVLKTARAREGPRGFESHPFRQTPFPRYRAARTALYMDRPYHIAVFDSFHPHEPDEGWVSETIATAEAAVTAVKNKIDDELAHFWAEVCQQDNGISTLETLISQYNSFAEMPVAFNRDGDVIFDSTAYMQARAAEMINEARAQHGLQSQQGPRSAQRAPSSATAQLKPGPAVAKHRFPALTAIRVFLTKPQPAAVLWAAFLVFCLICGLIYRALR